MIITDDRNDKLLDCLDIATTLMNDTGSGVFYHCLVDDMRLISENPDLEKILDESEKKYANLMSKLIKNGHNRGKRVILGKEILWRIIQTTPFQPGSCNVHTKL